MDVVDVVDRMTEYFNVDITDYKIEILYEQFKTLTLNSENESKEAREKLITFSKKINLDTNNENINKVNEIIKEYDRQFRTVNNIEFDTREEAVIARNEKTKNREIYKQLRAGN